MSRTRFRQLWPTPNTIVALAIGLATAAFSLFMAVVQPGPTDLAQVLYASRALLRGVDPYPLIGPGGPFHWAYPFYYPAPAALLVAPIAFLPTAVAEAVFVGLSIGLLAFALMQGGRHRLLLLLAAPVGMAIKVAQWSPLAAAAFTFPALAWLWAAKPNFAIPFLLSRPSKRAFLSFGIGALALSLVALWIAPAWPLEWFRAMRSAIEMRPPVLAPYVGPLLFVLLWRWRDPDARLLLLTACVPQSLWIYNAVPALLVAHTRDECWRMVAWSWLAAFAQQRAIDTLPGGGLRYDAACAIQAALFYLPAAWMVLRRRVTPAVEEGLECDRNEPVLARLGS